MTHITNALRNAFLNCNWEKFHHFPNHFLNVLENQTVLRKEIVYPFSYCQTMTTLSSAKMALVFLVMSASWRRWHQIKKNFAKDHVWSKNTKLCKNDGEHELTTENVTQFQLDVNFEPEFGTSNAPFKIVKREYLIMTWMSFIGNVGGTLGLFVGFSFVTTSEWFVDATVVVWNRMRRVINKPTVKP